LRKLVHKSGILLALRIFHDPFSLSLSLSLTRPDLIISAAHYFLISSPTCRSQSIFPTSVSITSWGTLSLRRLPPRHRLFWHLHDHNLSTFTLSHTSASEKISSLSADISITSSILTSLDHTIQEYEAKFHFKIDNFQSAKAACERNFNNLGKAVKAVKRGESKEVIGKKIWQEAAEVGVWEKLKFALGGELEGLGGFD
jgi:hypothetical protein